ncbi:MAG: hypothetical protein ACO3JL_13625 [Myxococcota bacterium]
MPDASATSPTTPPMPEAHKPLCFVPIAPPPREQRRGRGARFAASGERRTRYSLPESLLSSSPVGFRTRVSLRAEEAATLLKIASLPRPDAFVPAGDIREQRLFEESSLSVLVARQSTNFRGWRDVIVGGPDASQVASLLRRIGTSDVPVLDDASHCHVVLSRPYRTPFTFLLTFVGHAPVASLLQVPARALAKRFRHSDDIPTIGYLQHLHLGVLADAMERAVVLASRGRARAQLHLAPMKPTSADGKAALRELEQLVGLTAAERRAGVRVGLIAQVGDVPASADGGLALDDETSMRLGAALMSLRSERIQPGVNAEAAAPEAYQERQEVDVPEALTEQCGRALYNAFAHFTGVSRDEAKRLVLLERVDVLTPNGRERLRAIRAELEEVTERVLRGLPLWADLSLGRALSRNTARGKKAFALAGQRVYLGGLSRREVEARGLGFNHAVRALGAAAARAALVAEISGTTEIPEGCDLLAGVCLMAGPVNQNDIGKSFFGMKDLLAHAFPERDPTSLLVWTLKAKTVADPVGNEEQLLNAARKGALVDLRPGPHEVIAVRQGRALVPLRQREGRVNQERAFADVGNFVTDPEGREIPGNRGLAWPRQWAEETIFKSPLRSAP